MMNKHLSRISSFFLLSLCFTQIQADEIKTMTGMYSYMADAGLFLECGDNKKRLPVAMEGDNIALERAYLKNRYQPGKSLLVNIEAHLETRPEMEGNGEQQVIIVDQFLSMWISESNFSLGMISRSITKRKKAKTAAPTRYQAPNKTRE